MHIFTRASIIYLLSYYLSQKKYISIYTPNKGMPAKELLKPFLCEILM